MLLSKNTIQKWRNRQQPSFVGFGSSVVGQVLPPLVVNANATVVSYSIYKERRNLHMTSISVFFFLSKGTYITSFYSCLLWRRCETSQKFLYYIALQFFSHNLKCYSGVVKIITLLSFFPCLEVIIFFYVFMLVGVWAVWGTRDKYCFWNNEIFNTSFFLFSFGSPKKY